MPPNVRSPEATWLKTASVCRFVEIFLNDPAHIGQKTHIQHPVHLIEHENFYLFETRG